MEHDEAKLKEVVTSFFEESEILRPWEGHPETENQERGLDRVIDLFRILNR